MAVYATLFSSSNQHWTKLNSNWTSRKRFLSLIFRLLTPHFSSVLLLGNLDFPGCDSEYQLLFCLILPLSSLSPPFFNRGSCLWHNVRCAFPHIKIYKAKPRSGVLFPPVFNNWNMHLCWVFFNKVFAFLVRKTEISRQIFQDWMTGNVKTILRLGRIHILHFFRCAQEYHVADYTHCMSLSTSFQRNPLTVILSLINIVWLLPNSEYFWFSKMSSHWVESNVVLRQLAHQCQDVCLHNVTLSFYTLPKVFLNSGWCPVLDEQTIPSTPPPPPLLLPVCLQNLVWSTFWGYEEGMKGRRSSALQAEMGHTTLWGRKGKGKGTLDG